MTAENKWVNLGDKYIPSPGEACRLPAGVYSVNNDMRNTVLLKQKVQTDTLIDLPNEAVDRVIDGIEKFWNSKEKYDRYGLVHKRGVLLYGPPGCGKTATVWRLASRIIDRDGLVVIGHDPAYTHYSLKYIRGMEPIRPLVIILEDLDQLIGMYGDRDYLSLLDGENQITNVVYIATTNHTSKLESRILNRPSRFDEIVRMGMPDRDTRFAYLCAISDAVRPEFDKWANDTEGMSLAHLKELTISVLYLEQDYDYAIGRLRGMAVRPTDSDSFDGEEVEVYLSSAVQ